MRINLWVGFSNTFHQVRDLIKNDPRVNMPALPIFYNDKASLAMRLYDETDNFEELLENLFYTTDKQELNLGFTKIGKAQEETEIIFDRAPPGTRIWFFRKESLIKGQQDYRDYFDEAKTDGWYIKKGDIQSILNGEFTPEELIERGYHRLDKMADKMGAMPWESFNLSDYWSDDVDAPTDLIVRKIIK